MSTTFCKINVKHVIKDNNKRRRREEPASSVLIHRTMADDCADRRQETRERCAFNCQPPLSLSLSVPRFCQAPSDPSSKIESLLPKIGVRAAICSPDSSLLCLCDVQAGADK